MVLGRSQLSLAPLIGVLCLLFGFFSWTLTFETIQIPRKLDGTCCGCTESLKQSRKATIAMHADGSIDIATFGDLHHVSAPHVAATLADLGPPQLPCDDPFSEGVFDQNHVQLQVDDSVPWGDFVEMVSSIRHITGVEVLVVAVDD
jgi:biopolymer transport protein ExbD